MDETWDYGSGPYRSMIRRHWPLWEFVRRFCKTMEVKSILDVGGGSGFARQFAIDYVCFDLNEQMTRKLQDEGVDARNCDFVTANKDDLKNRFDLVLILGVAEHRGSFIDLLESAVALNPKFVILSFFKTLNRTGSGVGRQREHTGAPYRLRVFDEEGVRKELTAGDLLPTTKLVRLVKSYNQRNEILDDLLVTDLVFSNPTGKLLAELSSDGTLKILED